MPFSNTATTTKKRSIGLDVARTIAILLVLFAHTYWISDNYPKVISYGMQLSGTIGVEVFFIISGFLIGRIVMREILKPDFGWGNIKYFLFRRWFRTFPNYYLILLVNVGIWFVFYKELPPKLYKYFIYIQNFSETSLPFYRISWSLAVEQFSYILGPVLLYVLIKLFPKSKREKLYLWVTLLIIACFTATKVHFYFTEELADIVEWNESIRKVLIYRLDIVYYGFLLRYIYDRREQWLTKNRSHLLVLGLFIIAILHVFRQPLGITVDQMPFFMIVLYLPLNSFGIACLMPYLATMEIRSKRWSSFFNFISVISYSLYLLHYTIILHSMKEIYPSDDLVGWGLWSYTFLYWGLSIGLSYLLYRFFEKPVTDLRDSPKIKAWFGHG